MPTESLQSILYVDDDADSRRHLGQLLRSEGFEVWEAGSGGEALRQVGRRPDLVLLDVDLPDLDGYEVCRQIRADPAVVATPVVQLSGHYMDSRARVRGLEGGADAYLTKPIEPDVLVAHIHALLRAQKAEESLRQVVSEWQSTFDAVPDGVCLINRDGTVRRCNRAMGQILGSQSESLIGRPLQEIVRAAVQASGVAPKITLVDELTQLEGEVTIGGRWYNIRTSSVLSEPGAVGGLAQIWEDVTDHRRAEEQLRQAQKMEAVGRLAGGIAHDFNNILTIINGLTELVMTSTAADSPTMKHLHQIARAGDRAAALTRQLLAFSRKQILQPVVLDLNALIVEAVRMLQRLLGEHIDLTTTLDPDLYRVKADPGQIEQILVNLLVNARDAMPQGGSIRLQTYNVELDEPFAREREEVRPGSYVMLAVTDTGCGMDEATRLRIFEPFFTTKEVGHGTGLGLAMVYGIVKQSGGHIDVYSEPGRGTSFKVYLPRAGASSEGQAVLNFAQPCRGTETILVVEDDEAIRNMVRIALQSHGYTVLEAANGAVGLRIGQEWGGPIHLLVTDMIMPGISGRQLAAALVAARPDLKVLFFSGYTEDIMLRNGLLRPGIAFLQKPFTPTVLARKVRDTLDSQTKPAS
jgi:PAS domain S-box-containing protein